MRGTRTRSERRQMERAKDKHMRNLQKAGYSEWKDITDEPHTQEVMANNPKPHPIKVWLNGHFIVQVFDQPENEWGAQRVMIRYIDPKPLHDWNILQRIKNDLFGPERTALEVYPAESNKQDIANIYWLWVLPEGARCPIEIERKTK